MATSAISHFKHDLDKYILQLRRTSDLAANFILNDPISRRNYLLDIDMEIQRCQHEFSSTLDPRRKMEIVDEIKYEAELTSREYQILRMKDYSTFIITDIFEDHGIIKYTKIAAGVVSGGVQTAAGYEITKLGKSLNVKYMKGIGVMLMAHGINNTYEAVSPLLYEHKDAGPIRKIYRAAAELLGGDHDDGDFSYSAVDFSLNLYSAYKMPVLIENPRRIVKKGFMEKPGNGKLFRAVKQDFTSKWSKKNTAMKIYQAGKTAHSFKLTFHDKEYQFDD